MKKLLFKKVNKFPKISQWFISLEGEGENVGDTSLYIRLAGCYSAACSFCDTKFSWVESSKNDTIDDSLIAKIDKEIKERKINRITITGGEPLHYVDYFNDIVDAIQKDTNVHLKHIGIESNGNLLKDKEIILSLLEQSTEFQRKGLDFILTVSPKLDPETCYENQLSKEEIKEMYSQAFKNIKKYLPININFKFVWNINEEMNKINMEFINLLLEFGISSKHIFLMPFTPEDPTGVNKEKWEESKKITANKALELGLRYSPRLHIDLNLD